MSFFATLPERTRRELLTLIASDGLRTTASNITRCPVACVVAAIDGDPIDLGTRQLVEDHCARVNGRRADYSERAERAPVLPKVRLSRYATDAVSRGVAQGYLDAAGSGAVASGPGSYVPGSGGPVPSSGGPPDRSAPSGVSALLARSTRGLGPQSELSRTNLSSVSERGGS